MHTISFPVYFLKVRYSSEAVCLESKGSFLLISSHDVTTMTATAKDITSVIVDARIFVVMTNVLSENFVAG